MIILPISLPSHLHTLSLGKIVTAKEKGKEDRTWKTHFAEGKNSLAVSSTKGQREFREPIESHESRQADGDPHQQPSEIPQNSQNDRGHQRGCC